MKSKNNSKDPRTKKKEEVAAKLEAKTKATKVLKAARLRKSDSTTLGLRKLDIAMVKMFGKDYDTKLKPLGITLSEKVRRRRGLKWTATGTVECTFPPWSCGPDVDF